MKLNLAILDKDEIYMKRIASGLSNCFHGNIEMYFFTDQKIAMETIEEGKMDVFLVSTQFEVDIKLLPARCAFAYFTEDSSIETYMGERTICKFQKIDFLHQEIVGLYAEVSGSITEKAIEEAHNKILLFSTPAGGTGTSTVAAGCAVYLARQNQNVLYMNLECLGNTHYYFKVEGNGDFSDVIYALKSRKSNINMKIRSVLRTTGEAVKYIESCNHAMDRLELTQEDVSLLFQELRKLEEFDFIVIDGDFSFYGIEQEMQRLADIIVMVSDGTKQANNKIQKVMNCFKLLDEQKGMRTVEKIRLCYNRFSNKTGSLIADDSVLSIGGIPKYAQAGAEQIIKEISQKEIFDIFLEL